MPRFELSVTWLDRRLRFSAKTTSDNFGHRPFRHPHFGFDQPSVGRGSFLSDRLRDLPAVALTPHSAQLISLPPGPIVKPSDTLLILVSKSPRSLSSHIAEPFSAHSGHVTCVTNRSRFAIVASRASLVPTGRRFRLGAHVPPNRI